jgi:hypothetical protein
MSGPDGETQGARALRHPMSLAVSKLLEPKPRPWSSTPGLLGLQRARPGMPGACGLVSTTMRSSRSGMPEHELAVRDPRLRPRPGRDLLGNQSARGQDLLEGNLAVGSLAPVLTGSFLRG